MPLLKQLNVSDVLTRSNDRGAVDPKALEVARTIVSDVASRGEEALVEYAIKFGDLDEGHAYTYTGDQLREAFCSLSTEQQHLLERTAGRIRSFATAQRSSLQTLRFTLPGGECGHEVAPVEVAGLYAPGGRYPLPSSVLMTCVTARVAGCKKVWLATPRPNALMLGAAHVAGADGVLGVGGVQAIAALAYGVGLVPRVDIICGPGNAYVTAAKSLVSDRVAIDMLAGPSECLCLVDEHSNAKLVAADLLAQAEHDPDASAILFSVNSQDIIDRVQSELEEQLAVLETREVAAKSLEANGFAVCAPTIEDALKVCDHVAPEHLEVSTADAERVARQCKHYGAIFIGEASAEVLGDYGIGPNHVLPTGRSARFAAGLSVLTFSRVRTWLEVNNPAAAAEAIEDCVELATLEGLKGHAKAARLRLPTEAVAKHSSSAGVVSVPLPRLTATNVGVRFALPKGHTAKGVIKLLADAGVSVSIRERNLRPSISLGWDTKLLNPRNVVEMLHHGTRDVGFCGVDLIEELSATNVIPYFDTGLDPVQIVAAAPSNLLVDGKLPARSEPYLIATEYEQVTRKWVERQKLNADILRTFGSTEVFPPDDADFIVDNTATGTTLRANGLEIFDTVTRSSTHLCVSKSLLENPTKRAAIDNLVLILKSALNARTRALLECNVSAENLDALLAVLPSLKQPTIAKLADNSSQAYAVKSAVPRSELSALIPLIKSKGASDILVQNIEMLFD